MVVCPVTLMGQWADELADKTKGRLKVLLHHGTRRSKDPADLAGYDIVLVTYQTLGQEFGKALKEALSEEDMKLFPPCGSIQWHRIVLDESHTVKNPNAQLAKACKALSGNKRLGPCTQQNSLLEWAATLLTIASVVVAASVLRTPLAVKKPDLQLLPAFKAVWFLVPSCFSSRVVETGESHSFN